MNIMDIMAVFQSAPLSSMAVRAANTACTRRCAQNMECEVLMIIESVTRLGMFLGKYIYEIFKKLFPPRL